MLFELLRLLFTPAQDLDLQLEAFILRHKLLQPQPSIVEVKLQLVLLLLELLHDVLADRLLELVSESQCGRLGFFVNSGS